MTFKSLFSCLVLAAPAFCQPQLVVSGLQGPQRLILTPQGNLLVSETSREVNKGRVSLVTRGGTRRTLIESLPSGIDVTGEAGTGPTAMAINNRTLYVALGVGDAERRGTVPGTSIHNPEGASSPIFASVLQFQLNQDVDSIMGAFAMTTQHQRTLTDGGEVELSESGGAGRARVSILARFPISEPAPVAIYKFSNIWGMAATADGRYLYVTDASMNSLNRIETATGRWRRLVRFPPVPNPTPVGPPMLDSVPTSVRIYGDQVLVSFLTGFPFVPGNARVLAVNPEAGTTEPFLYLLNSATDVLVRDRPNAASQFFALEFSQNQGANPPPPGRLLRYDSPIGEVAAGGLITPVSLAYDSSTQDLFILELRGQILRLNLQ